MGKLFLNNTRKNLKIGFSRVCVSAFPLGAVLWREKNFSFSFFLATLLWPMNLWIFHVHFCAFVSEIQCSIFQREEIQFLFQFFFKMKREMTTFAVTQNNGSILQLVHRHNFPHIFVQAKNHLHFVLGQSKVVSFQIVQQFSFDDTLRKKKSEKNHKK